MLLIGSRALATHVKLDREPKDWDYICTFDQFQKWTRDNKSIISLCVPISGDKFHVRDKDGMNYEFEIAWPGSSGEKLLDWYNQTTLDSEDVPAAVIHLLMLKESHRFKKNSVHFLKTMRDIQKMREIIGIDGLFVEKYGAVYPWEKEWFAQREKETYTYQHPKLDVSKKEFFTGDGVEYVYDHDSIHLAVALLTDFWQSHTVRTNRPAYTGYMKDKSEVMTSKEKFFSVEEKIRLYGVYEESCVLALERSQIPHGLGKEGGPSARWSFLKALEKVCSSITSGWFRDYAWENYQKVLDLYNELGEDDYIKRFKQNQHLLKPYTGETY